MVLHSSDADSSLSAGIPGKFSATQDFQRAGSSARQDAAFWRKQGAAQSCFPVQQLLPGLGRQSLFVHTTVQSYSIRPSQTTPL